MNEANEQRLKIARNNAVAGNHLGELIEETFVLVEKHMPEVDTINAKKRYTLWSDKF